MDRILQNVTTFGQLRILAVGKTLDRSQDGKQAGSKGEKGRPDATDGRVERGADDSAVSCDAFHPTQNPAPRRLEVGRFEAITRRTDSLRPGIDDAMNTKDPGVFHERHVALVEGRGWLHLHDVAVADPGFHAPTPDAERHGPA